MGESAVSREEPDQFLSASYAFLQNDNQITAEYTVFCFLLLEVTCLMNVLDVEIQPAENKTVKPLLKSRSTSVVLRVCVVWVLCPSPVLCLSPVSCLSVLSVLLSVMWWNRRCCVECRVLCWVWCYLLFQLPGVKVSHFTDDYEMKEVGACFSFWYGIIHFAKLRWTKSSQFAESR